MRDAGQVKAGHKVLINGASGGVGSFAVQIAEALGAEVTSVCSTANVEMVRSLGADHVIDYSREDFTAMGNSYDVILDNVENRSLSECRRALAPTGTLVLNSGTGATGITVLVRLVKPFVVGPFVRQRLRRFLSVPNYRDLKVLTNLIEAGALRALIDKAFPLSETAMALRYIENGHTRGKVVITM
jgi:NADPH:quinone reductase-like Zn-dependent oxidoreductase